MSKVNKKKTENMIEESVLEGVMATEATTEARGPRWTPEQLDAIERRGENLLVAAAAGSGKTSVMVERVKRMVCDEDIPVEDILVVTFTNAAAAEMKDRIRAALSDAVDSEDPSSDRSKILRAQLRNLPLAQISTFHAFGMSVIKRFFYLTDLDPGTRVGEETEFAILKEEALDELLDEEFEKSNPSFIEFMDNYSSDRGDYLVRNLILDATKKIFALPHGLEWAEDRVAEMENIREDFAKTSLWKILKADIEGKLEKAISLTVSAVELLESNGIEDKAEQLKIEEIARYGNVLSSFRNFDSEGEGEEKSPEDLFTHAQRILTEKIKSLNAPKGELAEVYKDIKSSIQHYRGDARKTINDGIIKPYLANDISDIYKEIEMSAVSLRELIRLTARFNELYSEKKRDAGMMDFDDIEQYTLAILEHDEASDYYKSRLKYIFVDEYQDTNLMQEAIISRIKGDNNLFMVGDIKQSIYKFRLAEPSIFQGKYERFKGGLEAQSDVIDLNRNHRSKSTIVDFINGIFRPLMSGYDKDAQLYCGDKYDGELLYEAEIHVVMAEELTSDTSDADAVAAAEAVGTTDVVTEGTAETGSSTSEDADDLGEDNPEMWDKVYLEAKHVARIIKENLGNEFMDSKAKPIHARPLEKRDVVVLMRSVSSYASLYSQALQEEGIDAYLEGDDGYFDTLEISAFINLLSIIDNVNRDVPLISVLHSGIFGFTSKELAEIRMLCRNGSFSEAFIDLARTELETTEVSEAEKVGAITKDEKQKIILKCRNALDKIGYWQKLSLTMPLDRYVWRLMIESNCYVSMGALPRGSARQANLRALCDMAEKYTSERQATLYGFLNYISAVKSGNVKTPEVSALGEGDDVVRIMTIHKSKGLEFPMVIVSGLGSRKSYASDGSFRMHKDIGMSLTLKSGKDHWRKETILKTMISSRVKQEEIEEEIRVLYVALTRARDILYLVGYEDKDIDEFAGNGIIAYDQYLKMIVPNHSYKVIRMNAGDDITIPIGKACDDKISHRKITEEERDAITKNLGYKYPYEDSRRLKSKYSVSELNKASGEDKQNEEKIMRKKTLFFASNSEDEGGILAEISAAERGTVYHKILEKVDFTKTDDPVYVDSVVSEMVEKGMLSDEEVSAVNLEKVKAFFDSEIGRRASKAASLGMLEKERPFTLIVDMAGQEVLVQGVIDCYFREDNGGAPATVLIDYKSNKVREDVPLEEELSRIKDTYRKQMEIYRVALLEAGLGPIDEVYLYLIDVGKAIAVD